MAEFALNFLVPSWCEVKVSVAAAVFLVVMLSFLSPGEDDRTGGGGESSVAVAGDVLDDKEKVYYRFFCLFV